MNIDPLLKARLELLAQRQRRLRLGLKLAACWAVAALLALGVLALRREVGFSSPVSLPLLALLGVVAAIVIIVRHRRNETDWREIASQIEVQYPALKGLLLTAVQQEPKDGELSYLQDRLVQQALAHSRKNDWAAAMPGGRVALAQLASVVALVLFVAALSTLRTLWERAGLKNPFVEAYTRNGITVSPGDTSIERGSSLVIMARFEGRLPSNVELVIGSSSEDKRRIPLVKSLADPMFGGSVPEVASNLLYHVEYAGERTRDFQVKVFEYPRLERADADVTYPEYTALPPKRIENTRRLSAVEGSRLDLSLQLNKPVVSARFVAKGGTNVLSLAVESNRPIALLKQLPLETNRTWQLQLVDAEGRTNKVPAQFVFDVLKNRAPEIKLATPRGDIRPSALEEISFDGTVWDDFGIQAYGMAYTVAGKETKFVELGGKVAAKEKHPFKYLLPLEELSVQPDQLISYFVWAEDIGPDGQARRTTGDLFFAEVRPFEEIFRESQSMASDQSDQERQQQEQQSGEQGQQGNRPGRLAELQKQIISATWRLQREQGVSTKPKSGDATKPAEGNAAPKSGALLRPQWPQRRVDSQSVIGANFTDRLPRSLPLSAGDGRSEDNTIIRRFSANPSSQYFGQRAGGNRGGAGVRGGRGGQGAPLSELNTKPPTPEQYKDDAVVVRDAQSQALDQAQTAQETQQDPRTVALWEAATKEMEKALEQLKSAAGSPTSLPEALAAEQAAYQALLKLQQRQFEVTRARNQRGQQQGQNSRQQQMQRQLDQLDLTQQENRYETQRQAQAPQNQSRERQEQLQVQNRLAELARRQQDLNDRLRELQTSLQEARTEQEREEIRRQLKRLQEEEQQMVADADELQQRMDRQENQSRMAEQRQQLEQARQDMQRAADAAQQGAASQALASGTRAQRQVQQIRDDMRRQNSSEFAEDLRQMRSDARELARQEQEVQKRLEALDDPQRRNLTDADERKQLFDQLTQQKQRLTNLVERAEQVSQQTEATEPLVSKELYDTIRKFNQEDANNVKQLQEQLLDRGLLTYNLRDRLKETAERDEAAKSVDLTSEMLRQDYLTQARQAEERARAGIGDLRRGVESAAEKILGDDAEALRLAQQQLDQLTEQLNREVAQATGQGTNVQQQANGTRGRQGGRGGQAQTGEGQPRSGEQAQAGEGNDPNQQQANAGGRQGRSGQQGESAQQTGDEQQQANAGQGRGQQGRGGRQGQPGNGQQGADELAQNDNPGQQPGQGRAGGRGGRQGQPGNEQQGTDELAQNDNPGQQPGQGRAGGRGQGRGGRGGSPPDEAQQIAQNENQPQDARGEGRQGGRQGGRGGGRQGGLGDPNQQPGEGDLAQAGRGGQRNPGQRGTNNLGGGRRGGAFDNVGGGGNWWLGVDDWLDPLANPRSVIGPIITGDNYANWSDQLRAVEEMVDDPNLQNQIAQARERARLVRQQYKNEGKKPDWAVVQLQVVKPLVEVRDRIAEELARRTPNENLVPIDRDPVPTRYSELVRRYYEELGKEK